MGSILKVVATPMMGVVLLLVAMQRVDAQYCGADGQACSLWRPESMLCEFCAGCTAYDGGVCLGNECLCLSCAIEGQMGWSCGQVQYLGNPCCHGCNGDEFTGRCAAPPP